MRIITLLLAISFFNFKTDLSAMFFCTESVCWFIEQSTASLSDAVPAITVPLAVGGLVFGCIYYKRHILLDRAVTKLDKELISMFLFFGADPSKINPETGESALHSAVQHGDLALLRLLLAKTTKGSAGVNAKNYTRETPLYLAAKKGKTAAVRLLLGHGADPTIPNVASITPYQIARNNGHEEVVNMLDLQKYLLGRRGKSVYDALQKREIGL